MRTLVIDCSTQACSAALFEGPDLIDGQFELLGRGHAERLVPMIAQLPGKGRAERIVAGLGPGSFTGVRVAIAAARALGLAWGATVTGFPSLALVAAMARGEAGAVPVGAAMTGGHGEWFIEGYGADGAVLRTLTSLAPDEAAAATPETLVAGTEATALVARRGHGKALTLYPDARAFALLPPAALRAKIDPIYGRGPDARLPGVA
jgi:tRNA threonylcarbamoyladenosine biosynthesis protein TsaB